MKSICLSDRDWSVLLPVETFKLGVTSVELKPLGLESFAKLLVDFKKVGVTLSTAGITLDNYRSKLFDLVKIIVKDAPDILTTLTNIDVVDIRRLPPSILVELVTVCFRINITSQDDLIKNLKTLTDQVVQITEEME